MRFCSTLILLSCCSILATSLQAQQNNEELRARIKKKAPAEMMKPADPQNSRVPEKSDVFENQGKVVVPEFVEARPQNFTLGERDFLLDGTPVRLISGEMHYCRIPREYWLHRIRMAKAMGFNAIATYVMWNHHELRPGVFDFETDNRNLREFIRLAQSENLFVILRPGPYACAEWEFGGYPWWLLKDKTMKIRTTDPKFMKATERYFAELYRQVGDYQISRGGPIIMVQVENEYGSYGKDLEFMRQNRDLLRKVGFDVPLFSADGDWLFANAAVEGVLPGANGETNPVALKDSIAKYHGGKGPFFTPEWYPGWLDHWGEPKQQVPADKLAGELDELLRNNISVNFYMFHGGTTFGFMNGANYTKDIPIQPDLTSYDYDAPLNEAGQPTEKYYKLRDVIRKYLPVGLPEVKVPDANPVIAVPQFYLPASSSLFRYSNKPVKSVKPKTMEALDQGYGFVLYRTSLKKGGKGMLKISGLRDYAIVYVNGVQAGVLDRRLRQDSLELNVPGATATLDILVENMGRINYGKLLPDNEKGITDKVTFNGRELLNWDHYAFPFDEPAQYRLKGAENAKGPTLLQGTFTLRKTGDTFLDMRGWGKGFVWVNGHNLGRFWNIGPQQTLYVPGCWLKEGKNEVMVLDLFHDRQTTLQGLEKPILNELKTGGK